MNYSVSALRKLVAEMCWMVTSCNVSFKILNIVQPVVYMLRPVRRRDIRPHSEQTGWATIRWEKPRAGCRNFERPPGSEVSTSTCQPQHWNRVTAMVFSETGWLNKLGPAPSRMAHPIWLADIRSRDWQGRICGWKLVGRTGWLDLT